MVLSRLALKNSPITKEDVKWNEKFHFKHALSGTSTGRSMKNWYSVDWGRGIWQLKCTSSSREYPAILNEQEWSTKKFLHGQRENFFLQE